MRHNDKSSGTHRINKEVFYSLLLCVLCISACSPSVEIQNVEPDSLNIGDLVAIQGLGFGYVRGDSRVFFYGAEATEIVYWNNFEILARAPEGIPFGQIPISVEVTNQGLATAFVTVEEESILNRILAFGDSLTLGFPYVSPLGFPTSDGGYPYYLEELLDTGKGPSVVINGGVPGEITSDGLQRLESSLTRWNDVEYVLLMEGANDVFDAQGISLEAIISNLRNMIQIARDNYGMTVVLGTIPPRPYWGNDMEPPTTEELVVAMRTLAAEEGIALVDQYAYLLQMENWESYFVDGLHLNYEGYSVLADSWYHGALDIILP